MIAPKISEVRPLSIQFLLATLVLGAGALQLRPLILLVARHLPLNTHKDASVSASIDTYLVRASD